MKGFENDGCSGSADAWVQEARSSWAVGWTYFASVMMLLIGIFQSIAGLIWALTAHGRDVSNDGY